MSESGSPGRYSRSANGLIAALVVTVLLVVALVGFRESTDTDLDNSDPDAVDYLETVGLVQDSGVDVVYPPTLPDGWKATNVAFVPGERPAFGLSMLTDDETFVGVRQEDESVDDLLETYVDEETSEEDPIEVDSEIATSWAGYSDEGGDLAYTAVLGDDTVMVFGSAETEDLRRMIESLTTRPLEASSGSTS